MFYSQFLWASQGNGWEAYWQRELPQRSRIQKLLLLLGAEFQRAGRERGSRRPQGSLARGRDLSLQTPRTLFPLGPWQEIRAVFFTLLTRLQPRTCRFCSWREVVLLLQLSSWALLQSCPGCFGWFGGKLWSLHHLIQTGGPLVANCGWKAGHWRRSLPWQVTAVDSRSSQGPWSRWNNFARRGGAGGVMSLLLHKGEW